VSQRIRVTSHRGQVSLPGRLIHEDRLVSDLIDVSHGRTRPPCQNTPTAGLFGDPSHLQHDVSTTPETGNQPAGRRDDYLAGPLDSPPVQVHRNGSRNPVHIQNRIGSSQTATGPWFPAPLLIESAWVSLAERLPTRFESESVHRVAEVFVCRKGTVCGGRSGCVSNAEFETC
jgi:hypothetical protein